MFASSVPKGAAVVYRHIITHTSPTTVPQDSKMREMEETIQKSQALLDQTFNFLATSLPASDNMSKPDYAQTFRDILEIVKSSNQEISDLGIVVEEHQTTVRALQGDMTMTQIKTVDCEHTLKKVTAALDSLHDLCNKILSKVEDHDQSITVLREFVSKKEDLKIAETMPVKKILAKKTVKK